MLTATITRQQSALMSLTMPCKVAFKVFKSQVQMCTSSVLSSDIQGESSRKSDIKKKLEKQILLRAKNQPVIVFSNVDDQDRQAN